MRSRTLGRQALGAGVLAAVLSVGTIVLYVLVNARQPVPTPAPLSLILATIVLTGIGCAPIAIRRRWPGLAVTIATVLVLAGVGLGLKSVGPAVGLVVCAYTLATLSPFRTAGPVLAGLAAAHAIGGVVLTSLGGDLRSLLTFWGADGRDIDAVIVATLASYGLPAIVGSIVRSRQLQTAELLAQAERLEAEREVRDRAAATEERARIARELHDIAAHDLSAIVVQAGAADRLVDADPVRAKAVLQDIRGQGRQTLASLRQLVGILHDDALPNDAALPVGDVLPNGDAAGRRPQPGLSQLGDLLAVARAAGMQVDVATNGVPQPLRAQVDLAAFRVIQEALTNARRHAPGAPVSLQVTHGRHVSIVVSNERPRSTSMRFEAGHGLVGMRERVSQAGGTVEVGPTPDGRWVVAVHLPSTVEGR